MRTRLISLLTAGALAISSLVIAGSVAQADDETTVTISGTLTVPSGYALSGGNVTAVELTQTQNGFSQGDSFVGQLSSDGRYRISGLTPGATYAVFASPARLTLSQGDYTDLLTSFYGGYASYYILGGDLEKQQFSDSKIQKVSGTTDMSGVDITMALGAKITGTVYMPDGTTPAALGQSLNDRVFCVSSDDYNRGVTYIVGNTVSSGGSYSCTGIPGQQYVVWADVSGYPIVWRGQFAGSTPTLPNDKVTQITAGAAGETTTGQDITLVEGSTISGTITYGDDAPGLAYVAACQYQGQNDIGEVALTDCHSVDGIASGSSYTISDLAPGASYMVYAVVHNSVDAGNCVSFGRSVYLLTWYGDGFVEVYNLPDSRVHDVTAAEAGGNVPNIDITVLKSGDVDLTLTYDPNDGANTVTETHYWGEAVDVADNTFSRAGYDFVSWNTAADGSGTTYNPGDNLVMACLANLSVTLYAQWTPVPQHTVTFDARGGTPTPDPITADAGSTVVLPAAPTRDGYVFGGWYTQKDGAGTKFKADTVVNGDVTVYAYWTPVAPPTSGVVKEVVVASTTGGASRLADGKDSYALVTTLVGGDGAPMPGLAKDLAAVVPANVAASSFVDNGDGTYTLQVESSVPGNYVVTVTLDGDAVGSPIPVNFIGASIEEQVRAPGESQSATGLGFLPGEQVTVTVHSDPVELGVETADAQGRVPVAFDVPSDFALGHHTVDFAGAVSGTVSTGFSVAVPAAGGASGVETGGTVQDHSFPLLLAGMLVVAGLAIQRLKYPHTAKRG